MFTFFNCSMATTSFQKKARVKINQIPGTKPSLFNNQLLISSGVPSLDNIIGKRIQFKPNEQRLCVKELVAIVPLSLVLVSLVFSLYFIMEILLLYGSRLRQL